MPLYIRLIYTWSKYLMLLTIQCFCKQTAKTLIILQTQTDPGFLRPHMPQQHIFTYCCLFIFWVQQSHHANSVNLCFPPLKILRKRPNKKKKKKKKKKLRKKSDETIKVTCTFSDHIHHIQSIWKASNRSIKNYWRSCAHKVWTSNTK